MFLSAADEKNSVFSEELVQNLKKISAAGENFCKKRVYIWKNAPTGAKI
jgi:hypothetical protein